MADIERLATTTSASMHRTVVRLGKLAAATLVVTAAVGIATFATGWWVFDGSLGWIVLGGVLCAVPFAAAAMAWWLVRATLSTAKNLATDLRTFLAKPTGASSVLIDYDSGTALQSQARSFGALRADLTSRRTELPALYAVVRAVTGTPGLAAVAVLGTLLVGGLGTILLIAGL
ncbi:MAG: hypothetical protein WEB78_07435, partial [Ilumatobacteraceae bacterium]